MEHKKPNNRRKFKIIGLAIWGVSGIVSIAIIAGIVTLVAHSAMFERWYKSIKSNYGGGINRTVSVYDMQGDKIKEYTGKFDIKESDNQVFFDMQDGKRVQIWNGTVISEEN